MLTVKLLRRKDQTLASNLLGLTTDIVTAPGSNTEMSTDELINEVKAVHLTLEKLEKGESEQ